MKRMRRTARIFAAAVVTAAFLGGQVYPAWAGYDKKAEKESLFPDNITVDAPTELESISLPESDYGTFSWCDASYIPTKRVESCKVRLKPFDSVDLSAYSGWDEEKGVLIGKVTVVTLSYEGDETTEETTSYEENGISGETIADREPVTEEPVTEEPVTEEQTAVPGIMPETAAEEITLQPAEGIQPETAGEQTEESTGQPEIITEQSQKNAEQAEEPADQTEEMPGQTEETTEHSEKTSELTEETTQQLENMAGQTVETAQQTEETTGQDILQGNDETPTAGNDAAKEQRQSDSQGLTNQPELPGAELLVPLAPSVTPEQAQQESTEAAQPETSEQTAEAAQDGTSEKSEDTEDISAAMENLSPQEQAEQAATNHTCSGITVSGGELPWYVQFQVSSGADYQFSNEEGAAVFSSYEFQLWNLKNNTEYEIPDGEYISVTIPVKEGYTYTIEHILDNGAIETIVPSVSGGVMVFSTHSFSPFGIAGTKTLVGEEIAEKTYTDTTVKATVTPTPTATPTPTKAASAAGTSAAGTSGTGSSGASGAGTGTTGTSTGSAGTSSGAGTTGSSGTSGTGTAATGTAGTGTTSTYASGTGTASGTSSQSGAVKTADETPVGFFGILAAAAAGLAALTAGVKRRRN